MAGLRPFPRNGISRIIIAICIPAIISLVGVMPAEARAKPLQLYKQGKMHLKLRQYSKAIYSFSTALSHYKRNSRNYRMVLLARARAYHLAGRPENAIRDLDRVAGDWRASSETRAHALLARGNVRSRENDYASALTDLTAAIETPHHSEDLFYRSYIRRAWIFMNLGKLAKASKDLNRAVEIKPNSAQAHAYRARVHLSQDKTEFAKADAREALRLNPDPSTEKVARGVLDELAGPISDPDDPYSVTVPISGNGHIYVHLSFGQDHRRRYRFMLDTGATFTLIGKKELRQISRGTDVYRFKKTSVRIADGSRRSVTMYKIEKAFLYELPLGEIVVHVFDKPTRKHHNLLGVKSLKNVSIAINNRTRKAEISITDPDEEEEDY